jgi:hypothetical protein
MLNYAQEHLFSVEQQPNSGIGLFNIEVYRWHTITHTRVRNHVVAEGATQTTNTKEESPCPAAGFFYYIFSTILTSELHVIAELSFS